MKSVGPLRKVKLRGREKLWWLFTFTAAAFNIWRIPYIALVQRVKEVSGRSDLDNTAHADGFFAEEAYSRAF